MFLSEGAVGCDLPLGEGGLLGGENRERVLPSTACVKL